MSNRLAAVSTKAAPGSSTQFQQTVPAQRAALGLATATRRHLFSGGPARPPEARHAKVMDEATMWVLIGTFL